VALQDSDAETHRENGLSLRAKRSNPVCSAALDCFVAHAPRNDDGASGPQNDDRIHPTPRSGGGRDQKLGKLTLHKRDQVTRMKIHDWLALSKDERNDLVRRAQCDLLGSFRHCADKHCRRARWCASADPRACKDKLWRFQRTKPKTLRKAVAKLEDIVYWRT